MLCAAPISKLTKYMAKKNIVGFPAECIAFYKCKHIHIKIEWKVCNANACEIQKHFYFFVCVCSRRSSFSSSCLALRASSLSYLLQAPIIIIRVDIVRLSGPLFSHRHIRYKHISCDVCVLAVVLAEPFTYHYIYYYDVRAVLCRAVLCIHFVK